MKHCHSCLIYYFSNCSLATSENRVNIPDFSFTSEHRFLPWVTLQRLKKIANTIQSIFLLSSITPFNRYFTILAHVRDFERSCETKLQFIKKLRVALLRFTKDEACEQNVYFCEQEQ